MIKVIDRIHISISLTLTEQGPFASFISPLTKVQHALPSHKKLFYLYQDSYSEAILVKVNIVSVFQKRLLILVVVHLQIFFFLKERPLYVSTIIYKGHRQDAFRKYSIVVQ